MSLFGGGRGKRDAPRTAEDRRKAMEERERRRAAAEQRVRTPGASVAPPASSGAPARDPNPGSTAPPELARVQPAQPATPPAQSEPVSAPKPRAPKSAAAKKRSDEPLVIEPQDPAQPVAPGFTLADHREIAVHRRRLPGVKGGRTVVSSPDQVGAEQAPSRRRRWLRYVVLFVLLLVVVSQWLLWQPFKGGGGDPVTVTIPEGSSAAQVARHIADAGVVDSATLFSVRAVLAGKRETLSAGTLKLREDMSYGAALAALSGAVPATPELQRVTIPEGLSISEIDRRLRHRNVVSGYAAAASALLESEREALRTEFGMPRATTTLDGLLFPSTFEVLQGFKAPDLTKLQLDAYRQTMAGVDLTKAKKAKLSAYKVTIIASMVEREARLKRERPLISAVIHNRLKAGMPLGIDATFRYASGNWTDPIKQSELDRDGPYNSRLRKGLPPTPIGNPGLDSLEAAANPADVDFLYFVVKPGRCGEHAFSSTVEKFNNDVAKYQEAREAAGGSPVTC